MKRNFVYATFLALSLSMSACEMDTFNEQDAIAAQKELMNTKYQNETELEKLRGTAATALEQLRYTNALAELRLNDELSRGAVAALEVARQADALALESARQANALALQNNANEAALTAAKAKAEADAAAAAKAAEVAENARLQQARQDYSVAVIDVNTRAPLADADVSVASEGKMISLKTNAAGVANFQGLVLYPISRFNISKTGFTTASITANELGSAAIGLLNTAEAKNELKGKLFLETDLTNVSAETAPANVLVTASTNISQGNSSYRLQYAARTNAAGEYSLKVPDAPNGYTMDFEQIAAEQKLYVNGVEDNAVNANVGFPYYLPSLATVKTYFDVKNPLVLSVPNSNSTYYYYNNSMYNNRFYFKVPADLSGDVAYFNATGVGTSSAGSGNEYRITDLNYGSAPMTTGNGPLKYAPNATLDVELVDWTGRYVKDAPKLVVYTNSQGNLIYNNLYYTSASSYVYSNGYLHFKRQSPVTSGASTLVAGAQGIFKMADDNHPNAYYYQYNSTYYGFNFYGTPVNASTVYTINPQSGMIIVRNFYYGVGFSRERGVF
jgi:hypothetical protein